MLNSSSKNPTFLISTTFDDFTVFEDFDELVTDEFCFKKTILHMDPDREWTVWTTETT